MVLSVFLGAILITISIGLLLLMLVGLFSFLSVMHEIVTEMELFSSSLPYLLRDYSNEIMASILIFFIALFFLLLVIVGVTESGNDYEDCMLPGITEVNE